MNAGKACSADPAAVSYDCTKPGATRLDELHRAANDLARLAGYAETIAHQCARARNARPGDGAGGVIHPDGTEDLTEGETEETIEGARQAAKDQAISWWAEWEPALTRLGNALRIAPPPHLHLDLAPAGSALGQLIELLARPLFNLPGVEPGEHLMLGVGPFGVGRDGCSCFPEEAAGRARAALGALVTELQPYQRDGYEWEDQDGAPDGRRAKISKPDGWSQGELIRQVREYVPGWSEKSFQRIRNDAGLRKRASGGQGPHDRYGHDDLLKLIEALDCRNIRNKQKIRLALTNLRDG